MLQAELSDFDTKQILIDALMEDAERALTLDSDSIAQVIKCLRC